MATIERACDDCGTPYLARRKDSRFCSSRCRVRSHRGTTSPRTPAAEAEPGGKVVELDPAGKADKPPAPERPVYDTLEDQVRKSLTDLLALDTISGMAAVRVAQQIDKGFDSGSAVSTLTKELSRLVGEAKVEAAPRHRDGVTDLEERVAGKVLELVQ